MSTVRRPPGLRPLPASRPASPAPARGSGRLPPPAATRGPARRRAVVHLIWDGRRVWAWAETPLSDPYRLLRGGEGAPPHPFAADGAHIATVLGLPRRTSAATAAPLTLALPARAAGWRAADPSRLLPLPSPALGGPVDGDYPTAPFTVPAIAPPGETVAALLFAAEGADAGGLVSALTISGARFGDDAHFWRAVARLALTLCAHGAFVPDVQAPADGMAQAAWRPVLAAADRDALAVLSAAVPPACLALAHLSAPVPQAGATPVDFAAAAHLVGTFLDAAVDLAVRTCLGPHGSRLSRALRGGRASDRWMIALLHPTPLPLPVGGDLSASVSSWTAPVRAGPAAAVRLILRLEEPVPDERDAPPAGATRTEAPRAPALVCPVTALAQTLDPAGAPGDTTPLADLWAEADGVPGRAALVREAVTRALASAANAQPIVAPLARDPAAGALRLSPEEAIALVEQGAGSGAEVLVPAWWRPRPASGEAELHVTDAPAPARAPTGSLPLEAWAEFRWEVALGGERIEPAEFEALVRSRQPLVRLRSGWVRVDPAEMRRIAAQWAESGPGGRLPLLAAVRLALELETADPDTDPDADPDDPPATAPSPRVTGAVAEWLERLRETRQAAPLPEPPGFAGTLRPYQRYGLGWLDLLADLGLGGCLADDMGLGKTIQVLALLLRRKAKGLSAGPTLLVCPTSVLGNWAAEARRFTPDLVVLVQYGPGRPRGEALRHMASGADLVLTTYALLARDAEELAGVPWDGAVLDEAQNVKNPAAVQSQAARSLRARYRFALTGTPIENGLRDLWSIFAFCLPGYLGAGSAFARAYAAPVRDGERSATRRLRRAIAPFVLRRSKRDPAVQADLPPKIEVRQECRLTAEQASLYAAVSRDSLRAIGELGGMQRKAKVLTTLLRLKQICDHPSLYTGDSGPLEGRSGKLARLEELIADVLAEGDRALIFTQFATWARRLTAHLRARTDCPAYCLDGSVPGARRAQLVAEFQAERGPALFVLSLKAGGAGLNLTAAHHVFHYDRWWNPAVEAQATDRAHRIGQSGAVQVHRMIVPGTLEERIDQILTAKAAVAEEVVGGASEAWLTELSTERLREILTLGSQAREEG